MVPERQPEVAAMNDWRKFTLDVEVNREIERIYQGRRLPMFDDQIAQDRVRIRAALAYRHFWHATAHLRKAIVDLHAFAMPVLEAKRADDGTLSVSRLSDGLTPLEREQVNILRGYIAEEAKAWGLTLATTNHEGDDDEQPAGLLGQGTGEISAPRGG